ncbi:MAG TPA: glycosyltransferase family 4 protein [Nitrospirae bacterium]|nr:D-inositol-3-phosphate glycosyltransferase [bacterium BMS3Abin06]HDH12963.1 glycosyltransferase family 4 protein [Nitrospirota bacterium]HDZ00451.1 glycosyltransferase family 4 protein [Nitrospirota bacterium]
MTIKTKHEKLTVLHIATLNQPIRLDLGYGPIETIIYNIDKGLHSLGNRSIIACSGDSRVAGEHYVTVERSIGDYFSEDTPERRTTMNIHLSRALNRAKMGDIDVIHTHDEKMVEYIYDGVFNMHIPIVMTLHVPARDIFMKADCQRMCNSVSSPLVYCVPISEYQKRQYDGLVSTENVVHHGIEAEEYPFKENPDKGSYLFTIGRVTRDKGQDKAIEIAKKTGSKLIIAGCVQNKSADREFFAGLKNSIDLFVDIGKQPVDNDYYEKVIKPLLDSDKQIIYIGEIKSEQKKQWYLHARATLFPIQWGEPFGLVLIESMACGTPAIALNKGAVQEIMVDGKTGFVVDSMSEMIEAVDRIDSIDPCECRRHVLNHFSITTMANKYSEIYKQIIDGHEMSDNYSRLSTGYPSEPLHHGMITR